VLVGWWIPERALERRTENSKKASQALKTILLAELKFRSEDLDNNGVFDFWTGDVASLSRFGLIDRSVAEADARPLTPFSGRPIPYCGYFFVAMDDVASSDSHHELRMDTDNKSGKVHHRSRFAFCAYPAQNSGNRSFVWIVSEDQQIWMSSRYGAIPVLTWPSHKDLRENWSRPE